ncbi:MAG: AI-2E family transporter [Pyrinomonadaceae bacterium MAG19_C2-C3]|nr:AI-2E family transporter [Pyrinomonadaceae bacterium MAG19_C2-C3]
MDRFNARWLALIAVTAAALYLCWNIILPFVDVLAWSTVLVIVFYPVHRKILERVKSPSWSAVISCVLVIITILLPLTLLTLAVVNEAGKFAQSIQASGGNLLNVNSPTINRIYEWLGQYVDVNQMRSQEFIVERVRGMSGAIANRTLGLVGGVAGAIVQVFFIIFTMYYFFRDGDNIRHSLYGMVPLDRGQTRDIFARTRDVISASLYGVVVIAVIQGAMGGIAFWLLGIPSPLLWSVVMMFLCLIPMLGAFVVWVPAAIYLAANGSYVQAAILVFIGAVPIGMVDNFLRPKLVGEKTRLHELLIFFSVLGGLQVFGVLGIVMGPVVVVITLTLIDILRHSENSQAQNEPTLLEEQEELRNVEDEASDVTAGNQNKATLIS